MPPDVILALVEAGVVLWVDGDRLRFRAPERAFDDDLRRRAAACRGALVALVKSGALLPPDLGSWPPEWREAFEERAGLMQFDGGLPRDRAEAEAERRVRLDHARRFIERAALVGSP